MTMDVLHILTRALKPFLLLAAVSSAIAHARTRNDLCGISMHTSDFPDLGDFSTIESTLTVPQVFGWPGDTRAFPQINHGVALCCGDDCSARLSAYISTWISDTTNYTAGPWFHFYPYFTPHRAPSPRNNMRRSTHIQVLQFSNIDCYLRYLADLNASDTLFLRLERIGPTRTEM